MEVIFRKIEVRTKEVLDRLEVNLDDYCALHIYLSKLQKENKSLYQNKIAVNIIHEFLSEYNGWILHFMDGDLVVICENINDINVFENIVKKVRDVFMDDRLAYFSNKLPNPAFSEIYEFPFNFNNFKKEISIKINRVDEKLSFNSILQDSSLNIKKYDSHDLSKIERELESADLNNVIRKQPVCAVLNNNQKIKPFFHEIFVSIDRLKKLFSLDVNFNTNILLLKSLNALINKALIVFLIQDSRILLGGPISVNISPDIILSDLFTKFHKLTQDKLSSAVILEIDVSEVLLDTQSFYQAVIYAKELGYKICLDNINEINVALLNREILRVDFGKFECKNELYKISNEKTLSALNNALENFGINKLIINNCNNEEIISFGKKLGVSLFQGLECDKIMKEKNSEHIY